MKLTPLDIRHQEFATAITGYNRKAVRAFLADVASQMEDLLRENLAQQERVLDLERRVEAYRTGEEELKRTLVSAERISAEMRSSAQRETELLLREAEAERDRVLGEVRVRSAELEAQHGARIVELESASRARASELESGFHARSTELENQYNTRFSELESSYAARFAMLEQTYSARAAAVEHEAMVRRTTLENSLARLKAERAQFLAQYRSLLAGFAELARQHEADLDDAADLAALRTSAMPTVDATPRSPLRDLVTDEPHANELLPEFSHSM
ncbi:DivIVA domain-containing protein [Deinococcus yavapaiensis]|uniref:Cell division initiation protein n=1 Tax=Deinococcus yavapaiensis KR-236 TaxID=694435 RepID=A0A318S9Z3_9DEIO|nr:DivIVA domain-containing protein [Deinococcus yavapaiensis]PYE56240.1 cell division initiation protein [Deinococcus yavapaiensis KR-236]